MKTASVATANAQIRGVIRESNRGTAPPPPNAEPREVRTAPSLNGANSGADGQADATTERRAPSAKSESNGQALTASGLTERPGVEPAERIERTERPRPNPATSNAQTEQPTDDSDAEQPAQLPTAPRKYPRLYKPEYCHMVIEHMSDNHGLTAFGGLIDVAPETVYKWARDIPEFAEACAIGKGKRAYVLEKKLSSPKSGPEIAGTIFTIKNAVPDEYREKVEHHHTGMTDEAIKSVAEAVRLGVADAVKQLGDQGAQMIKGTRVIEYAGARTIDSADYHDITPKEPAASSNSSNSSNSPPEQTEQPPAP